MAYLFLVLAIVSGVGGTTCLRLAADDKRWYAFVAFGYLVAFAAITLTLANGLPLGLAYGIWSAAGVALTAVISKVLFREPLTWLMALGIALIIGGVLLLEVGAAR